MSQVPMIVFYFSKKLSNRQTFLVFFHLDSSIELGEEENFFVYGSGRGEGLCQSTLSETSASEILLL
jgi:hypothetical protein